MFAGENQADADVFGISVASNGQLTIIRRISLNLDQIYLPDDDESHVLPLFGYTWGPLFIRSFQIGLRLKESMWDQLKPGKETPGDLPAWWLTCHLEDYIALYVPILPSISMRDLLQFAHHRWHFLVDDLAKLAPPVQPAALGFDLKEDKSMTKEIPPSSALNPPNPMFGGDS